MKGIAINSRENYFIWNQSEQLNQMYWLIDAESTPFERSEECEGDWDTWEEMLDKACVDLGERLTNILLLKPGWIMRLLPSMKLDEWTYFIGISTTGEPGLNKVVQRFFSMESRLDETFFNFIQDHDAAFLLFVDSWWEVYNVADSKVGRGIPIQSVDSSRWEEWERKGMNESPDPF